MSEKKEAQDVFSAKNATDSSYLGIATNDPKLPIQQSIKTHSSQEQVSFSPNFELFVQKQKKNVTRIQTDNALGSKPVDKNDFKVTDNTPQELMTFNASLSDLEQPNASRENLVKPSKSKPILIQTRGELGSQNLLDVN